MTMKYASPSTPSPTSAPASTSTNGPAPKAPIDAAIRGLQTQLTAYLASLAPATQAPGLHLSPADVRALDDRLGLGATVSGVDLVRTIDRLASIRIGDIRIPFTPGQLAELQHRASKRGRTVEQEMRAVVARIEEELFYKGG